MKLNFITLQIRTYFCATLITITLDRLGGLVKFWNLLQILILRQCCFCFVNLKWSSFGILNCTQIFFQYFSFIFPGSTCIFWDFVHLFCIQDATWHLLKLVHGTVCLANYSFSMVAMLCISVLAFCRSLTSGGILQGQFCCLKSFEFY